MRHPFTHHPSRPSPAIEVCALLGSEADREAVEQCARNAAWQLWFADSIEAATARTLTRDCAVLIVDRDCLEPDWRIAVERLAKAACSPCVLFVSPVVDRFLFEEVVRHGGFDLVPKPIESEAFLRVARLAIAYWKSRHPIPAD